MASPAERFLKDHRSEIVGRVKRVNSLADCLLEKEVISKEALNEISSQKPEEEQMRTVYKHLNSSKAYELTLEWLKRQESHVMEDLAEKTETQEPSHPREKRLRIQNHEAMDETDCDLQTSPDLKILSTMAKLDKWVSDPKISQKLIDDLEKKLKQDEMEALENYLKDMKLKKSLCLTFKEINEIRQRKDLRLFLTDIKGAKFPKNTLNHFFEKVRSNASTAKKKPEQYSDNDDSTKHNADDLNSSGYGSSCSSSFNSRVFPQTVSPNEDVFLCEGFTDVSHTHNMEVTDCESKNADLDSKVDVPHPTENADQIQQAVRSSGGSGELKEKQEMDDTDWTPQTSSQIPFNLPHVAVCQKVVQLQSKLQDKVDTSFEESVNTGGLHDSSGLVVDGLDPEDKQQSSYNHGNDFDQPDGPQGMIVFPKREDVPACTWRRDLQLQSEDGGQLEKPSNTGEELKKANCSKRRNVEGQPNRRIEQSGAVLCDWLMNQCSGSEKEFKKLFDRISVKHVVEHSEYPFFIAENVTVFKNPQTGEEQIIVEKDERKNFTETTSLIHYQMFVCDIQKTVLLGSKEPKEKQIGFEESEVPVNRCLRSILEVFAPALAVFKNIQRKERLDSYLKTIEGRKENPC